MPTTRPLIMLDLDGVINDHEQLPSGYCGSRRDCVDQLNRILRETDAEIVISSAWRYMIPYAMGLRGFTYLLQTHGVDCHDRIIGVTCRDEDLEPRGLQIRHWLNEHGGDRRYVVLDDLDEGITEAGHPFVQTDGTRGLTAMDADQAIAILKGEPIANPDMTLDEAASALYEHFGCGVYPHWVQSIGVAAVGQYNDTARICVMLVRKPRHHEGVIPETWHGYPVETKVIGEVRIGPPGD